MVPKQKIASNRGLQRDRPLGASCRGGEREREKEGDGQGEEGGRCSGREWNGWENKGG